MNKSLLLGLIVLLFSFSEDYKSYEIMKGTIQEIPFTNKKGTPIQGVSDLFFKTSTDKYFIKISESNFSKVELLQYKDVKIKIQGEIEEGLWDTDDPNIQSRIGTYITIQKIF